VAPAARAHPRVVVPPRLYDSFVHLIMRIVRRRQVGLELLAEPLVQEPVTGWQEPLYLVNWVPEISRRKLVELARMVGLDEDISSLGWLKNSLRTCLFSGFASFTPSGTTKPNLRPAVEMALAFTQR